VDLDLVKVVAVELNRLLVLVVLVLVELVLLAQEEMVEVATQVLRSMLVV